jgi:hypothetical protein
MLHRKSKTSFLDWVDRGSTRLREAILSYNNLTTIVIGWFEETLQIDPRRRVHQYEMSE